MAEVEVLKITLPSGIEAEIKEIDGAAEKALTNQRLLKSGKAMNVLMQKAIVTLNGKPLPQNTGEANALLLDLKTGDRN
ncbi:MAG: hypothetical protein IJ667_02540, partial [Synergistaceae bacterium]|nr:hypothetical protein [Synergistaceae bacterium]